MLIICDRHHPRQIMQVVKNGEAVDISPIAEIRGDIYRCPLCGNQVITDFGEPQPKKDKKRCLLADDCPEYDPENILCNTPLGGNLCEPLRKALEEDP